MSTSRPKQLGSFEVLREISQGGMGVIYLGSQPALERFIVLKKIRRDLLSDPSMVERFQREARAAAAVHHQNVVAVYDCFTFRGDHYIAQEYVDGLDLRAVLKKLGKLEPEIAALIGLEIARGLEEIHARGIVHRDLKPSNVLLGSGGETKLADFGIALEGGVKGLTRPGILLGSIPYMSPEQMLGERVDYRSDLFLLGLLLYEMITASPPFQESTEESNDTLLERMQAGRFDVPRKHGVHVPFYLRRLISRCLRAKPGRRMQSATMVRRLLERRLDTISPADCRRRIADYLWEKGVLQPSDDRTAARPMGELTAPVSWLERYRRRWIPAAASLVLVSTMATVFWVRSSPKGSLPEPANLNVPRSTIGTAREASPSGTQAEAGTFGPTLPAAPASVPAEPAHVRFVADPWAKIRLPDGTSFLTPRAEALNLEPGSHRVVFEHPSFGRAEYTLELSAGETKTLRHVYDRTPSS